MFLEVQTRKADSTLWSSQSCKHLESESRHTPNHHEAGCDDKFDQPDKLKRNTFAILLLLNYSDFCEHKLKFCFNFNMPGCATELLNSYKLTGSGGVAHQQVHQEVIPVWTNHQNWLF